MAEERSRKTGRDTAHHSESNAQALFIQTVKSNLTSVKTKVAQLRRTDTQLFVLDTVSPAAATLVAALAAGIGGNHLFVQAAAQSEDGGWKVACILAAIFGFIATISGMFKKQYDDRLARGNQCVGRLLSLDLALTTSGGDWEAAAREYGELIKTFPEFLG